MRFPKAICATTLKPITTAVLLTFTVAALLITSTRAIAAASTCASTFSANATPLPVQLFLLKNAFLTPDKLIPEMKVRGTVYRDLVWLGKGRQGQVFRAEAANGRVAIKVFHSQEAFKESLGDFARYKYWLPKLIAVDKKSNTIVMEYREGISVLHIRIDGESYGISEVQRERIEKRWRTWVDEQKQIPLPWYFRFARRPSFLDMNVIYSFRDDTFYMIDVF